jgi:hypothetical protein
VAFWFHAIIGCFIVSLRNNSSFLPFLTNEWINEKKHYLDLSFHLSLPISISMSELLKAPVAANPANSQLESNGGASMAPPAFALNASPIQRQEADTAAENQPDQVAETLTYGDYTATRSTVNTNLFSVSQGETVTAAAVNLSTARAFMIGGSADNQWDNNVQYNYNTAIRICEYVSTNVTGVDYSVSTDLEGTSADDVKIVSDKVIMGIALLQAANGLTVDGKPGGSFITDVIGGAYADQNAAEARLNYMNEETTNTDMLRPDNTQIEIPDFGTANEATLYDFFRDITMARNGLWSDNPEITNIVSLRRALDPDNSTDWNDTAAVAWVEGEGDAEVKHCKIYIGSTEPGDATDNRHIQPQTVLTTLGLHKSRQAGGRNSHVLVQDTNDALSFDATDGNGFNHHPGGMTGQRGGMEVTNDALAGLPGAGGAMSDSHFTVQHKLSEIFYILGNWGEDRDHAAYWYLDQANDAAVALLAAPVEGQVADQTAIDDFTAITTLFTEFEAACLAANATQASVTGWVNYLKQTVEFSNEAEADAFEGTSTAYPDVALNDGATEINANVSLSSEGCQNIFGGDAFYDYWHNMQQFAEESGQRRWYYTVVDLTTNYNAIQTQQGQD